MRKSFVYSHKMDRQFTFFYISFIFRWNPVHMYFLRTPNVQYFDPYSRTDKRIRCSYICHRNFFSRTLLRIVAELGKKNGKWKRKWKEKEWEKEKWERQRRNNVAFVCGRNSGYIEHFTLTRYERLDEQRDGKEGGERGVRQQAEEAPDSG